MPSPASVLSGIYRSIKVTKAATSAEQQSVTQLTSQGAQAASQAGGGRAGDIAESYYAGAAAESSGGTSAQTVAQLQAEGFKDPGADLSSISSTASQLSALGGNDNEFAALLGEVGDEFASGGINPSAASEFSGDGLAEGISQRLQANGADAESAESIATVAEQSYTSGEEGVIQDALNNPDVEVTNSDLDANGNGTLDCNYNGQNATVGVQNYPNGNFQTTGTPLFQGTGAPGEPGSYGLSSKNINGKIGYEVLTKQPDGTLDSTFSFEKPEWISSSKQWLFTGETQSIKGLPLSWGNQLSALAGNTGAALVSPKTAGGFGIVGTAAGVAGTAFGVWAYLHPPPAGPDPTTPTTGGTDPTTPTATPSAPAASPTSPATTVVPASTAALAGDPDD